MLKQKIICTWQRYQITSALPSITNADAIIQSLMNGSLDDIICKVHLKKQVKILLKLILIQIKIWPYNCVEAYGVWMADGKVLGDEGAKIYLKTSTALVVPANSIINLNTGELKGSGIW